MRDIKAQIDRHALEHTVRVQVLDDFRLNVRQVLLHPRTLRDQVVVIWHDCRVG